MIELITAAQRCLEDQRETNRYREAQDSEKHIDQADKHQFLVSGGDAESQRLRGEPRST